MFGLFPTIYIPEVNDVVFRMTSITWEWGLCAASVVFYIVCAEGYKALKRRYLEEEGGYGLDEGKSTPGTSIESQSDNRNFEVGASLFLFLRSFYLFLLILGFLAIQLTVSLCSHLLSVAFDDSIFISSLLS